MKRGLVFAFVFSVLLLISGCSGSADQPRTVQNSGAISGIELINDSNRAWVGKEVRNDDGIIVAHSLQPGQDAADAETAYKIPENRIIQSLADNSVIPGRSIREISVAGTETPEVICPNGAIGIFTNEDGEGWNCAVGDVITWSFEKYPFEDERNQILSVGYVKDGVMYGSQLYQEELTGTYEHIVEESGVYYVYFMCGSSDPLSLKSGEITVENK